MKLPINNISNKCKENMESGVITILKDIFKLLKVPVLLGYILVLILLVLSALGFFYIKEMVQDDFEAERLVRESEYNEEQEMTRLLKERDFTERKDNEKEILKILNIIASDIRIYLDWPHETPFTSIPDFDKIIENLNMVIENNTYNFSPELRTSLVRIRFLLVEVKVRDQMMSSKAYLDADDETHLANEKMRVQFNEKFDSEFLNYRNIILTELRIIEPDLRSNN